MGKPRNSKKNRGSDLGRTRRAVADNVKALCEIFWREETSATGRYYKLAERMGSSLSQVQRIVEAVSGISVDELDRLADVFNVAPHDLATPYKFRRGLLELVPGAEREIPANPKQRPIRPTTTTI